MSLTPKAKFEHKNKGQLIYVTQKLTLSANAGPVDLEEYMVGGVLYSVELVSSADDAVTFTLNTGNGAVMATITTTGATNGEWMFPDDRYPINSVPNYTLSGLGSGTVEVDITVWKA